MFFYDVDTGIVLFEMPEMFHAEPHEITEDDFIDRIVGGNEKRFALIYSGIIVKGGTDAFSYIFQRFPAGHLYLFRPVVPKFKFFRIVFFDFIGMDAFPSAVRDFRDPLVDTDIYMVIFGNETAGIKGTGERSGDGRINGDIF